MNKTKCAAVVVALLSTTMSTVSFATPTPKYLGIKNVQKCLSEVSRDDATFVCMPQKKPAACTSSSWKKLKSLKGDQKVPACPLTK